ncbi:MAG: UrcA family protein [Alteraurantiacibacter sp.]
MKTFALAAAFAAGLLSVAGAAAATETQAEQREAVTLRVNSAGVNFADPAEVAAFRREVARQIEAACNPGDRVGADAKPDFRCRREMAANMEPVVNYMAQRATRGDTRFVGLD